MLNEEVEYRQYTDNSTEERLSELIKKDTNRIRLVGINRPVSIIARKKLTEKNYWNIKSRKAREKIREKYVLPELNDWCFNKQTKQRNLQNILKKDKEATDKADSMKSRWNAGIYDPIETADKKHVSSSSVLKWMNFRRIISEAVIQGPLQERCLIFDIRLLNDIMFNNEFYYYSEKAKGYKLLYDRTKAGKLNTNNKMFFIRFFKMIIACMMKKDQQNITQTELINWMNYPSYKRHGLKFTRLKDGTGDIFTDEGSLLLSENFIYEYNIEIKPAEGENRIKAPKDLDNDEIIKNNKDNTNTRVYVYEVMDKNGETAFKMCLR